MKHQLSSLVYALMVVFLVQSSNNKKNKFEGVDGRAIYQSPVQFLKKYGYLAEKHDKTTLTNAIKTFQQFFKLKETGVFDSNTTRLMKNRRCGQPDIVKPSKSNLLKKFKPHTVSNQRRVSSTQYQTTAYNSKKYVLFYYLQNDTIPSGMDVNTLYAGLEHAFNTWAAVTNLLFLRGDDVKDPDIFIGFHSGNHNDGFSFDGKGGVVAHTSQMVHLPNRNFSFIHFDKDEVWVFNQTSQHHFIVPVRKHTDSVDFVLAAMHEIGHVLGIHHTNSSIDSIMQAYLPNLPAHGNYGLGSYDIQAVQQTYGQCEPAKINSIFSVQGKTYIIVGPFTYLFNDQKVQVEQSWPRLTKDIFGIDYIEEGVVHSDRFLYLLTRNNYHVKWIHRDGSQANIMVYQTSVWPGISPLRPIDGIFVHANGSTFIFQQEYVYKWDNNTGPKTLLPFGKIAAGWPRRIKDAFPGVPDHIDTVFRWPRDSRVYFFKDQYFYIWDENLNKADGHYSTYQWKNVCNMFKCKAKNDCLNQLSSS